MREVIKHKGAKVKLSVADVNEIVKMIIGKKFTLKEISDMYAVQEQMIKNLYNGKGRFKYLLGTERYFEMHAIRKTTLGLRRNKLTEFSQKDLNLLYTRLHSGETGHALAKEYHLSQSNLSKFKNDTLKSIKGNIVKMEITHKNNPIKEELLELARQTTTPNKKTVLNVLDNVLDSVCKIRLKNLIENEDYFNLKVEKEYTDDMQTGLLIYEILSEITNYDNREIEQFIMEVQNHAK